MTNNFSKKGGGFNVNLPVGAEADVIVAGSGPAGIAASIAAARKGLKVILLERFSFLGGMSTQVPIATWPLNTAIEEGELDMPYDGILGEIIQKLDEQHCLELKTNLNDGVEAYNPVKGGSEKVATSKWYLFDPEELKFLYFNLLHEAGVKIRVNSLIVDTIVNEGQIDAVVVETLTRRELIKGKIFIDCTGSAELVVRSGSPVALGAGENDGVPEGIMIPLSTTFRMAGVNTEGLNMTEVEKIYEEHRKKGDPNIPVEGLMNQIVCKGVVQIFGTRVFQINPLDPEQAAEGEFEQRRQIRDTMRFLKREIPAFKDCQLISTGITMGVIGTRRIRGDYFITYEDIFSGEKFEDAIATGTYRLEYWEPDGSSYRFHHLPGTWYTIPYRSLLPTGLTNLLVAGSCISGQLLAMGPWAIQPVCFKTGQAAGTAAALCMKLEVSPRQLGVSELQTVLRKDGMFLG
jgi:hypothetical protein